MFIYFPFVFYRKYSRVKLWSLNLSGSKDQIAVLRAVGSISRTRGGINVGGDGIVSDQFIEQIRRVRGLFLWLCISCRLSIRAIKKMPFSVVFARENQNYLWLIDGS
jgi:hypothetical protein